MSDDEENEVFNLGKEVPYCPNCSFPFEYCEYGPTWDKCKAWLEENDLYATYYEPKEGVEPKVVDPVADATKKVEDLSVADEDADEADEDEKTDEKKEKKTKKNKRGGKVATKEVVEDKKVVPKFCHISKNQRNKRKCITVVKGLETYNLKLKDVAKKFSKKFACSASVSNGVIKGESEIHIQGDVSFDLPDFLVEAFNIEESTMFFTDGAKKKKCFP